MSNADNSRIANDSVDLIVKVTKIAKLGLSFDETSVAAAALKDILKAVEKFKVAEMAA